MASQFGERIRELRTRNNLLLRQMASLLEIDTALLSKIERGERPAKKESINDFANILKVEKDELLTLWLADQVYEVVQDETLALKAMQIAEKKIKYQERKK